MEMEWLHLVKKYDEEIILLWTKLYVLRINVSCDHSSTDEFAEVMQKTVLHQKMPFNMDSSFIKLYFGKDKQRLISYAEFSQFLHVSLLHWVYAWVAGSLIILVKETK